MTVISRGISRFLALVVGGSSEQRLSLSHCSDDLLVEFQQYSGEASAIWRILESRSGSLEAYLVLLSISRMLSLACTDEVFKTPAPNFRALSRSLLEEHLDIVSPDPELIKNLSIILKRIRRYGTDGRDGHEGFRIDSPRHREILSDQNYRCNLCLYKFSDTLDLYYDEGLGCSHFPRTDEVCLETYHRRPEIDHIVPITIGGNGDSNLQVLCKACNLGKSDWISSVFVMPSAGRGRAFRYRAVLTHQMRFAVLARARSQLPFSVSFHDAHELRIFKRNTQLAIAETNLVARLG